MSVYDFLLKLAPQVANWALGKYRKWRLSREEKELLIAAAPAGELRRVAIDGAQDLITAGGRGFPDDPKCNREASARYNDAIDSLYRLGFVSHAGGSLYRLTSEGFEKARQLARKTDKKKANKH